MSKRTIYIATPCYGGNIQMKTMVSIMAASELGTKVETAVKFIGISGESLIQRARNTLVEMFLSRSENDDDAIMFVDGDIVFDPKLPFRLLETGHDVVGAAYPRKEYNWERIEETGDRNAGAVYFIQPEDGNRERVEVRKDCIPVRWLGTGAMLITKRAILKMQQYYPELMYRADGHSNAGRVLWSLFDCATIDGQYYSEDYLFCHRFQRMGGRVWLYVRSAPTHVGSCEYKGNLNAFLEVKS